MNSKVVLVTRRTRLDALIAQYNTEGQAEFAVRSRGADFHDYKLEHTQYEAAVQIATTLLQKHVRVQRVDREFLPNYLFGKDDIVVTIGQDGLVANTLKYLSGQPLIAVNPDANRYDGILLPFGVNDIGVVLPDVLRAAYRCKEITMAKASLNDGQTLLAVNDFYIGPRLPVSARYEIQIDGIKEHQSSSGVIVSTGLGSTGWLKSIYAGASALLGGQQTSKKTTEFSWDAELLKFAVREPFPSRSTGTSMVYGEITPAKQMTLTSSMASGGIVFSDGIVDDYVDFNSGTTVEFSIAETRGKLVV